MTNYKRFISYLYYYELGNQKDNVGFARVESSDELCKITIHCLLKSMPRKECKIHLLRRQTSLILSEEVGTAQFKDGLLDMKLSYENGIIKKDGMLFKDCIGIMLMYSKDYYIGAKWEGGAITYHEASLIEQIQQKPETKEASVIQVKDEAEKPQQDSSEVKERVIHIVPAQEVEEVQHVESEKAYEEKEEAIQEIKTEMTREENEEQIPETKSEKEKQEKEEKEETARGQEESEEDKRKEAIESIQSNASIQAINEEKMTEEKMTEQETTEQSIAEQDMTEQESEGKEQADEEQMLKVAGTQENGDLWQDSPAARTILDRFVKMYPFDDGEMAECVRLEPKDIGLFPMSAWMLGNNSFVLHSYCNYRHLLFAKKLTREGCEYYLMVPGALNQRERQLAKMFGFENFKCSRRRCMRDGEFGYWYVRILFNT